MDFLKKHKKLVFLNILSLLGFILFATTVAFGDSISFDSKIYNAIVVIHRGPLTNIMLAVSMVLEPVFLFFATLVLFATLLYFKKRPLAYFFLLSMVFGVGSALIIKEMFAVVRPISDLSSASGWSFPSGHATVVAVFFLTILYAVEEKISDRTLEILFVIVSTALILVSGFSRIYLGVHWTTDVLAGFALGLFWATLGILILKQYQELNARNHPPRP